MIERNTVLNVKNRLESKYGIKIKTKEGESTGKCVKMDNRKFLIVFSDLEEKFHELGHIAVYMKTKKELFTGIQEYEIPEKYFARFIDIYLYSLDWFVFLWEIENGNKEVWENKKSAIKVLSVSTDRFFSDLGKSILNVLDGKEPVGAFVRNPNGLVGILKYYIGKDGYSFEYKDGIVTIRKRR